MINLPLAIARRFSAASVGLPQHSDEHSSERPVLLAVDQEPKSEPVTALKLNLGDIHGEPSTVGDERRAADDGRLVARQEQDARRYLLRGGGSPEGGVLGQDSIGLVERDAALGHDLLHRSVAHRRLDPSGTERVRPDAVRPV